MVCCLSDPESCRYVWDWMSSSAIEARPRIARQTSFIVRMVVGCTARASASFHGRFNLVTCAVHGLQVLNRIQTLRLRCAPCCIQGSDMVGLPRVVEQLAAYGALEAIADSDPFLHQWCRPLSEHGRLPFCVGAVLAWTRSAPPRFRRRLPSCRALFWHVILFVIGGAKATHHVHAGLQCSDGAISQFIPWVQTGAQQYYRHENQQPP